MSIQNSADGVSVMQTAGDCVNFNGDNIWEYDLQNQQKSGWHQLWISFFMLWVRFMEVCLVFSNLLLYIHIYRTFMFIHFFCYVLGLPSVELTYAPPNSGLEDSFVLRWTVLRLYMFVGALVCLGFPPAWVCPSMSNPNMRNTPKYQV